MGLYFLSYDLRNERDYKTLHDELNRFNAIKMLDSCWCFKRINTNAKNLRDHFMKFVDEDDQLIVSEVAKCSYIPKYQWASLNIECNPDQLK